MRKLKIIFMGTPDFSVPTLAKLHNSDHEVVAVITSVDKYGGRGGKVLLESAVKKYAIENNIPVLQPKNLKSPKFNETLRAYKADIQVVVAFRMLPEMVWNMPPLGTINLHASLLPKYRGAAPINWAIIKGETETGLTTFKLKHEIDTGDLIFQHKLSIGADETAGELWNRMMEAGGELMLKTLEAIALDTVEYKIQNDNKACPAPKLFRENCEIDFNQPAHDVYNFIRGLNPYPGAWCQLDKKTTLKILTANYSEGCNHNEVGKLTTDNKTFVSITTQDGEINLVEVQISGKKRMKIKDLLNGYTFENETIIKRTNSAT